MHVAVVMPARNEELLVSRAISSVPKNVDCLIVVDDDSIDSTAEVANYSLNEWSSNRSVITRCISGRGEGVGAAIYLGIHHLSEIVENPDEWCVVVMAGDAQMDPADLPILISKLDDVDHVKGNRFIHFSGVGNMPKIRRLASRMIGFLTSLATGWNWGDPQCGYTATKLSLLLSHPRLSEWKGYGYPNWWALCFSKSSEKVAEVPVRSVYGEEKSGIQIPSFLPRVSLMLMKGTWTRGWSWYVLGNGKRKVSPIVRLLVISLWFSGWFSVVGVIKEPGILIITFALFVFVRILDRHEQRDRTRISRV